MRVYAASMDRVERDVPEEALLWLDEDNAVFLHAMADRFFAGDVNTALNAVVRSVAQAQQAPHDPWARQKAFLRASQGPSRQE